MLKLNNFQRIFSLLFDYKHKIKKEKCRRLVTLATLPPSDSTLSSLSFSVLVSMAQGVKKLLLTCTGINGKLFM